MTWESFKKKVDDHLAAHGLGQDVTVWFIDVTSPEDGDGCKGVIVGHEDGLGLSAWS